jgi:hypothetical protein
MPKQDQRKQQEARDEANKARFVDQSGLEASQLPDKGRPTGHNDTPVDIGRRNLPHQHGGELGTEGGLRGDRKISSADDHGGRKGN